MSVEYRIKKTNFGEYPQLECQENSEAIVRSIAMHGFGDCIRFRIKTGEKSTFGSNFGLSDLGCFRELKSYERLVDVPKRDITKLAVRIYETLFMSRENDSRYNVQPKINKTEPKYRQILEELTTLQDTQRRLLVSRDIVFPEISSDELAYQNLW